MNPDDPTLDTKTEEPEQNDGSEKVGALGGVLRRGAAMAAAGTVIVQVVTVVQTLVLARLLGPVEVGIYVAGTVLLSFLVVFAQSTLAQALIQRENRIEDAANTTLVVTTATGILLALAGLAVSPLIGDLFKNSEIGVVAAVSSGSMLLHALSTVPDSMMQRTFQFKRRLFIDPAGTTTFAVVAIAFGIAGFGAWAMVIGLYASLVVTVSMSWLLADWRPGKGRFSFRLWREMARFSLPLLIEGMVARAQEFVETAIVGRVLNEAALGNYRYGRRVGMMPGNAIVQICSYVLFPAFSRISGDAPRFRDAYLRALGWIWLAAAPTGALMAALGEPVAVVLLGEPWRGAGICMAAMFGMGLGVAMNSVTSEAMKGADRSARLLWMTAVGGILGLPLLVFMVRFGLAGVGLTISITYMIVGATGIVLACSVVGVTIRESIARMAPATIASAVGYGALAAVEHLVVHSDQHSILIGFGLLIAESAGFGLVFLLTLRLVSPTTFSSITAVLARLVAKVRRTPDKVQ